MTDAKSPEIVLVLPLTMPLKDVQGAQRCREGIRGPPQYADTELNTFHSLEHPHEQAPAFRQFRIAERALLTTAILCAQALHFRRRAGNRRVDLPPGRETIRLPERNSQQTEPST